MEHHYVYQNWFRGKRKIQTEEDTLWYYRNLPYPDTLKEKGKLGKKFAKTCSTSEDWARYAYENKFPFNVCKIINEEVDSYLSQDLINDIVICFLDEHLRLYMYYVFREQENGMLFCVGMKFFEHIKGLEGTNDYTKSWTYIFETNGNVKVIEREKDAKEECIWTSKRPLNVASNWEPKPEFGNWDSIFRMKRWGDGELDEVFKGVPDNMGMR
ncbi:hypothetical protein [uncultured Cytophaga sp.]|uniref:hypothetical protein n=1 Tax=uncultured Cytophaga sp. TaxID=160238 RepID=UPI00261CD927|nr:hypothetical protein [uncultured Cytophaga sp.]